ncbi:MAG TPA: DUF4440 domain-containing protein [Vicinamibacterales bacterium]|nr:DUF4440 domain-containing protein [Vicinamibacterales bacterium]
MVIVSRPIMLLLLLALASCAGVPVPADTSADVEAIRAAVTRATEINRAGDASAWADLFADGAIVMPDGAPEVTGQQDLQAFARRWFDPFDVLITIEPLEIEPSGDWAFVRTAVTGSLTPKAGGDPVTVNDKELAIFRRQSDGAWKVWRLIGNSNQRQ